jgi:hypothetical protein
VNRVSHNLDRVAVSFDDPNLVANAGLLLVGTLVAKLGLERLVNTRSASAAGWAVRCRGARC